MSVGEVSSTTTSTVRRGPWWRHYLYGLTAILAGFALLRMGNTDGTYLVGAGVAFLGVGSGLSASPA